jgi:hypothetical protein
MRIEDAYKSSSKKMLSDFFDEVWDKYDKTTCPECGWYVALIHEKLFDVVSLNGCKLDEVDPPRPHKCKRSHDKSSLIYPTSSEPLKSFLEAEKLRDLENE